MNRPVSPREIERQAYYAEASGWAADAAESARKSRRAAWIVAGVATGIAALEALALASLMPLKTVQPYVVTVDRQSGAVQMAQGLVPGGALTQNQAVTQAALVNYVLARETFDATDIKENYRRVQLWSAPEAREAYIRELAPQNPQSPLKLYPPSTTVKVTVKGVTMMSESTALVRFDAERRDGGSAMGMIQPYTAAISFRYSGEPLKAEDRFVNPLGFQVTRYRRDADTMSAVPATFGGQR